ncbi:hypothetical protein M8J76_016933 [Diaphorina citri]|nr:hypothetical protein M8J75_008194 [Diaphorina citri]KAI5709394.1 hypothetical protein M8J76_016933 [Diaphorina citri]
MIERCATSRFPEDVTSLYDVTLLAEVSTSSRSSVTPDSQPSGSQFKTVNYSFSPSENANHPSRNPLETVLVSLSERANNFSSITPVENVSYPFRNPLEASNCSVTPYENANLFSSFENTNHAFITSLENANHLTRNLPETVFLKPSENANSSITPSGNVNCLLSNPLGKNLTHPSTLSNAFTESSSEAENSLSSATNLTVAKESRPIWTPVACQVSLKEELSRSPLATNSPTFVFGSFADTSLKATVEGSVERETPEVSPKSPTFDAFATTAFKAAPGTLVKSDPSESSEARPSSVDKSVVDRPPSPGVACRICKSHHRAPDGDRPAEPRETKDGKRGTFAGAVSSYARWKVYRLRRKWRKGSVPGKDPRDQSRVEGNLTRNGGEGDSSRAKAVVPDKNASQDMRSRYEGRETPPVLPPEAMLKSGTEATPLVKTWVIHSASNITNQTLEQSEPASELAISEPSRLNPNLPDQSTEQSSTPMLGKRPMYGKSPSYGNIPICGITPMYRNSPMYGNRLWPRERARLSSQRLRPHSKLFKKRPRFKSATRPMAAALFHFSTNVETEQQFIEFSPRNFSSIIVTSNSVSNPSVVNVTRFNSLCKSTTFCCVLSDDFLSSSRTFPVLTFSKRTFPVLIYSRTSPISYSKRKFPVSYSKRKFSISYSKQSSSVSFPISTKRTSQVSCRETPPRYKCSYYQCGYRKYTRRRRRQSSTSHRYLKNRFSKYRCPNYRSTNYGYRNYRSTESHEDIRKRTSYHPKWRSTEVNDDARTSDHMTVSQDGGSLYTVDPVVLPSPNSHGNSRTCECSSEEDRSKTREFSEKESCSSVQWEASDKTCSQLEDKTKSSEPCGHFAQSKTSDSIQSEAKTISSGQLETKTISHSVQSETSDESCTLGQSKDGAKPFDQSKSRTQRDALSDAVSWLVTHLFVVVVTVIVKIFIWSRRPFAETNKALSRTRFPSTRLKTNAFLRSFLLLAMVFVCCVSFEVTAEFSPSLQRLQRSATTDGEYGNHTRTRGPICQSIDVRNSVTNLDFLRDCVVIEGFLQIFVEGGSPEDWAQYSFPDLVEVTDYVLVYRNTGLRSLGALFPNLAIIRGRNLLYNYALVVYECLGIQELGLYHLTDILRGSVLIMKNPTLCFVDTVDWDLISWSKGGHYIKDNRHPNECPICDESCMPSNVTAASRPLCVNTTHCQKMCKVDCGGGACYNEGRSCCNHECIGGCTGNSSDKCIGCRHLEFDGSCVEACPATAFNFINRRCVTNDECQAQPPPVNADSGKHWKFVRNEFTNDNVCVLDCPKGYVEKEIPDGPGKYKYECQRCIGDCEKVCYGANIESIQKLQLYKECTYIKGSLEIQIQNGANVVKELEDNLGMVEVIEGYLKIARSYPVMSLNFFKKLRLIKGETLETNK